MVIIEIYMLHMCVHSRRVSQLRFLIFCTLDAPAFGALLVLEGLASQGYL